jgi:hypothetical protein
MLNMCYISSLYTYTMRPLHLAQNLFYKKKYHSACQVELWCLDAYRTVLHVLLCSAPETPHTPSVLASLR